MAATAKRSNITFDPAARSHPLAVAGQRARSAYILGRPMACPTSRMEDTTIMEKFINGMDLIHAGASEGEFTGVSPKRQVGDVPPQLLERLRPLFVEHGFDPDRAVRFFVPWNRDGIIFSQ